MFPYMEYTYLLVLVIETGTGCTRTVQLEGACPGQLLDMYRVFDVLNIGWYFDIRNLGIFYLIALYQGASELVISAQKMIFKL